MSLLLSYTEVAILTKEFELLIKYIKEGKEPVTVEIFIGLAKLQQESEKQRIDEEKKLVELIEKEKVVEEKLLSKEKEIEVDKLRLNIALTLGNALKVEKERIQSVKNKEL